MADGDQGAKGAEAAKADEVGTAGDAKADAKQDGDDGVVVVDGADEKTE